MTYIFVKHRMDGKYEVRFSAESGRDYRRMLLGLRVYVPGSMRAFKEQTRTWVVEARCGKEVELWLARMIEDINPAAELYCERNEAGEAAVSENYRTLHVLPTAGCDFAGVFRSFPGFSKPCPVMPYAETTRWLPNGNLNEWRLRWSRCPSSVAPPPAGSMG
jgi:hypothetical protein